MQWSLRPDFPTAWRSICSAYSRLADRRTGRAGRFAAGARSRGIDAQAAPFIMAALQVYWVHADCCARLSRDWMLIAIKRVTSMCRGSARCAAPFPSPASCAQTSRIKAIGICTAPCVRPSGIWCGSSAVIARAPKAFTIIRSRAARRCSLRAEACDQLQNLPQDLLPGARHGGRARGRRPRQPGAGSADDRRRAFTAASGNPLLWQPSEA